MSKKTKNKKLTILLMLLILFVFIYITFKTTLVIISNKYLTDIGDYSINENIFVSLQTKK